MRVQVILSVVRYSLVAGNAAQVTGDSRKIHFDKLAQVAEDGGPVPVIGPQAVDDFAV